jgi:hypothetical protein
LGSFSLDAVALVDHISDSLGQRDEVRAHAPLAPRQP